MAHVTEVIDLPRFLSLPPHEFEREAAAPGRPFVLDVRSREAFEEGHVPGSAWIHVHELAPRRHELPGVKARRILLVGDDERRIGAAATWLALMGHADVAVLEGGFPAWTGPVESGPPPPPRPPGPQLRTL